MIKLRPHHGLCIHFYVGKGYDEVFTKQMNRITSLFEKEPNTKVTLYSGVDILCSACPNNTNDTCNSDCKVSIYDTKVMELCNLTWDKELAIKDFLALVKEQIIDSGLQPSVCKNCEWISTCNSIKNKLQ